MNGITDLTDLLKSMSPEIQPGEYVFCAVDNHYDYLANNPLAIFKELEGITLILPMKEAEFSGLSFQGTFKQITLTIHSSLHAVGLTAAVASQLAKHNISANVVAAYHHDHIFVPYEKAEHALLVLKELCIQS